MTLGLITIPQPLLVNLCSRLDSQGRLKSSGAGVVNVNGVKATSVDQSHEYALKVWIAQDVSGGCGWGETQGPSKRLPTPRHLGHPRRKGCGVEDYNTGVIPPG